MVAFSSILAVGTLVVSAIAIPTQFSKLDRRALPIGISVETARTYLSEREYSTAYPNHDIPTLCHS